MVSYAPMVKHVVYVAPFFMEASLRFLQGALSLDGVRVSLISQDPVERLPAGLRQQLVGHWRVANGLDATQIAEGVKKLEKTLGEVSRVFGPLEQLQVPLAMVREMLGIEGLGVQAAQNFRDKAQMKTVLADAGVPCARHQLIADEAAAWRFVEKTGFPVVVKPPAGAGGKSTFRLDNKQDLQSFLHRNVPDPAKPALYEEFVAGKEYSFDSVIIGGRPVWYSISSYQPTPL
ncbi:MAG: ATP-grasp domain-containing protein, partial [Gammaproteobacteria bacterium]|nr:ATP-grasp domain-containing protein [Gammaproteobacteria bacterium]